MPTENPELLIVTKQTVDPAAPNRSSLVNMAATVYTRSCKGTVSLWTAKANTRERWQFGALTNGKATTSNRDPSLTSLLLPLDTTFNYLYCNHSNGRSPIDFTLLLL